VKNILKKEITKADSEINRDQTIIKEYKQVKISFFKMSYNYFIFFNVYCILDDLDFLKFKISGYVNLSYLTMIIYIILMIVIKY